MIECRHLAISAVGAAALAALSLIWVLLFYYRATIAYDAPGYLRQGPAGTAISAIFFVVVSAVMVASFLRGRPKD